MKLGEAVPLKGKSVLVTTRKVHLKVEVQTNARVTARVIFHSCVTSVDDQLGLISLD
jgi:hypothetical protein